MAEQQIGLRNFFGELKKANNHRNKKPSKKATSICDHEAIRNSCEEGCCTKCKSCGMEVFS